MTHPRTSRALTFLLMSSAALGLAGCGTANKAQEPQFTGSIGSPGPTPAPTSLTPIAGPSSTAEAPAAAKRDSQPMPRQSALVDDTKGVAEEFRNNPGNARNALQYVYNLRDLGLDQQATLALAEAYRANPDDPAIASEYGRLLVGAGKDNQAERVLDRAADENRDWRALSALGTIQARAGNYAKATEFFRRANELEPKRASLINNLALALALDGKPAEAENLLRNADDSGSFGPRLRQNLALVLALQGKYDEAQSVATTDLPPKEAAANVAYIRKMTNATGGDGGIEFSDESITAPAKTRTATRAPAAAPAPVPAATPAPTALPDDGPATTSSIGKPAKPAAAKTGRAAQAAPASRAAAAPMELSPLAASTPATAARTAEAAPAAPAAPAQSAPPAMKFSGEEPAMTPTFASPLSLFSGK